MSINSRTCFVLIILMSFLVGCATDGKQAGGSPQIDRISAEDLERIMPQPQAVLSLDEIYLFLNKD